MLYIQLIYYTLQEEFDGQVIADNIEVGFCEKIEFGVLCELFRTLVKIL